MASGVGKLETAPAEDNYGECIVDRGINYLRRGIADRRSRPDGSTVFYPLTPQPASGRYLRASVAFRRPMPASGVGGADAVGDHASWARWRDGDGMFRHR